MKQVSSSQPSQSTPAAESGHSLSLAESDQNILLPIQCKLTVGAVDDPLEAEADAMADNVMRMPENSFIQCKCEHCEEEERAQRKPLASFIQKKETSGSGTVVSDAVNNQIASTRGTGSALDSSTKNFMESRFSADFSNVSIHTDSQSVALSSGLNAQAFTVGSDVYFNSGKYRPDSSEGKHLLAHELTHVVQQQGNMISKKPFIQRIPEDRIHGPILDDFSRETGVPRDRASQHSEEYRMWLSSRFINPIIDTSCSSNRQFVVDTVNESLEWIDDIYSQLIGFAADQIFATPGTTPSADHVRIHSALQQTFHTTDELYVQLLASRFYHIGRMLREPNRVTIFCGGRGCRASGSSIVGAFVDTPYEIHLCGTGRNIATFIHEMGHAVIPNVGVRNTVRPGSGITDRAYDHERVFHHLTPEEALDNAESYGILAEALHTRRTGNLVTPQPDRTNCTNTTFVLSAFARAELWTRRGWQLIGQMSDRLRNNAPLTDLPPGELDFVNRHLPLVTSTADLRAFSSLFTNLYTSSYHSSLGSVLNCQGATSTACSSGAVGISRAGTVTSSAVSLGTHTPSGEIDFCPAWFSLPETDRIRTTFALFLMGRPSWMHAGISMTNAFAIADFAKATLDETLPPPRGRDAVEHFFRDEPTAPLTTP
jgi:hypothetical protein